MVKSPDQWYGEKQFNETNIHEEVFKSMEEDPQHLMKIDSNEKTSFLGGYILAYSIRENMGTGKIIEKMPFQYRYVEPLRFAQLMEFHPEDIPETFDTPRGKNRKTVERIQFNGSLVYRIPIRALAYLSLPVVNQQQFSKLSSIDLAYKYRVTGDEKYLEEFLGRVKEDIEGIVNRSFEVQKRIFGGELLVATGLEGAKKAFCRYNFSRDVQIETFMQKFVNGHIYDFIRADDKVSRLVRTAQKRIGNIIEKANIKGEKVTLEEFYSKIPEIGRDTIDKAYKLATGRNKEVSLQTVASDDGLKIKTLQDLTEDEHPSVMIDPAERMGNKELIEILLQKLRPYEREMIVRYFLEGQTMKEIGKSVEISESRASQMLPEIIRRMRVGAEKYEY